MYPFCINMKSQRHQEILKAIRSSSIATQTDLRRVLAKRGYAVDQATLSRDIHELGLVKIADGAGYRYAPVEEVSPALPRNSAALLSRFIRSIATAGQLVVVKTDPGEASPIGLAIDRMNWNELVGTVAGDDTLFLAARSSGAARKLASRIKEKL